MEPVRPRKGSKGSRNSGSASPHSDKSNSRASSRAGSKKSSAKKSKDQAKNAEPEREVTFDDEAEDFEEAGYVLPTSDTSDDEDLDDERAGKGPPTIHAMDPEEHDMVPHLDEDAVKAELGGDPEHQAKVEENDSKDVKTTEEEEEEATDVKKGKKRGKKLKKTSEKRVTYDGREVVFVTEFTQTDWKWKEHSEKSGKGKTITPNSESESLRSVSSSLKSILVKPESREAASRARTEEESTMDDRTTTDLTPFSLQPNDEFGIPVLDMSSDSDSSDDDAPRKIKTHRHHLPSIGPPQILKYIRESDRVESTPTDKTSSDMDDDYRQMESADYVYDEHGNVAGMFSGPCEFCHQEIKPFPTLDQQLSMPPEALYCCEDYREFVEFAMTTANRLEEDAAKKNEKISIKVHGHHGSKQARKMAKEQAVQRMRERELQRRQQEATGMQQAFYQFPGTGGGGGGGGGGPRGPKNQSGTMMFKDMVQGYNESGMSEDQVDGGQKKSKGKGKKKGKGGGKGKSETSSGEAAAAGGGGEEGGAEIKDPEAGSGNDESDDDLSDQFPEEKVDKLPHPPALARGGEKWLHPEKTDVSRGGRGSSTTGESVGHGQRHGMLASYSSFAGLGSEVARQMKTINYQLSSLKCLEEGWTLRAPSPLEPDDGDCEVFVPEPLHPSMIATGKIGQRKLIEKFYPDGSKFLTMFPDGTGNVFYPSGRVAIIIISLTLGQYTYIVQDDAPDPEILAVFEPNGYGCCYFGNGKVRLTYDQMGGLELDYTGGKKRHWSWRDQETHVHAPPFQPIVFGMNRYIGVRFMAQESIALTLTGRKRSCRFNVGSKLKLVAPENIPPKEIDENQLFLDERKIKVEHILDKVTNLLKFPKSPKVDRLLPPLSLSSRQHKVDKMKQEYAASLAVPGATTPGRKKKVVKSSRLSPLPVVSVN